MKRIVLFSMLMMLPACSTSCGVTSTPTNSMPKPALMSLFRVGELVEMTFPNGEFAMGVILEVLRIGEVTMPDGRIQRSRIYRVKYTAMLDGQLVTGEDLVPEFAMKEVK